MEQCSEVTLTTSGKRRDVVVSNGQAKLTKGQQKMSIMTKIGADIRAD